MADDIDYRVMTEAHTNQVKQLMYTSFFREEPLGQSMHIQSPEETTVYTENLTAQAEKELVSIVAICRGTGEVIGCRLSVIETPSCQITYPLAADNPKHTKLRKIMTFLEHLQNGIDVFEHYAVGRCIHFQAISVRKDYAGRGIGKRLVEESVKVAKSKGIWLIIAEVTGKYSQRVYEKLGFDVLKEVKYDDYVDDKGHRIFGDTGIHTSGKLVARLYKDD